MASASDRQIDGDDNAAAGWTRRQFMGSVAVAAVTGTLPVHDSADAKPLPASGQPSRNAVVLRINGREHALQLESRVTLLDALREYAGLTGTKKGCDRGQCGACTVLVDGRRINACLTLAVMHQGAEIRTVEGLGADGALSAMQAAFIEHDAFQCGYCTPGQLCSATALVDELRQGQASAATADVRRGGAVVATPDEIRERMSGNLCRCGAYTNIVDAVRAVVDRSPVENAR